MPKTSPAAKNFFNVEGPIAIAHRGGDAAGHGKRNTMAAFRSAHKLGYRYMETDVVRTKDGKVLISHGARTTIGARLRGTFTFGTLENLTYKEIRQKLKVGGEPLPLLEEVTQAFPDVKFFVDPKTEAAVEPLGKFIKEKRLEGKIVVGSFYPRRTRAVADIVGANKLRTVVIVGRLAGLLRLDFRLFRRLLREKRLPSAIRADAFSVHHWLINRRLVAEAHRERRKVIAWTVNSQEDMVRLLNLGVDGVMSDRVKLLKEIILARDPGNQSIRRN